jgi:hypothetical protein
MNNNFLGVKYFLFTKSLLTPYKGIKVGIKKILLICSVVKNSLEIFFF